MYHNGQVVHNLETGKPCVVGDKKSGSSFAWTNLPARTTHYIEHNPDHSFSTTVPKHADGLPQCLKIQGYDYRYVDYRQEREYSVALPKTVEEAEELLLKGLITPAPIPHTHHWRCRKWKSNCQCEDKS